MRNFIKQTACSFYVAPLGIGSEKGVPRECGSKGHFSEQTVSICERGGFGIEIEEVVHQESAEVKAVFDYSSVNEFSGGGVSGFDS